MNSEEKAEQVQQPEQPETQQAQPEGGETEVDVKALQAELEKAKAQSDEYLEFGSAQSRPNSPTTAAAPRASERRPLTTDGAGRSASCSRS